MTVLAPNSAPSAELRPGGRCSRLPHFVGEAKTSALSPPTKWGRVPERSEGGRGQPGSLHCEDEAVNGSEPAPPGNSRAGRAPRPS